MNIFSYFCSARVFLYSEYIVGYIVIRRIITNSYLCTDLFRSAVEAQEPPIIPDPQPNNQPEIVVHNREPHCTIM